MPRATAAPPIPYSNINDQPINQATLQTVHKIYQLSIDI
jgi:hypothetical protein